MKSWINTPREYKLEKIDKFNNKYQKKIPLTEEYEFYNSDKLKTQLLPHQQRTLKAMMDLEKKRYIKISDESLPENIKNMTVETNCGILSEKPGSGKTFEILALITESNPTNVAEITTLPFPRSDLIENRAFKDRVGFKDCGTSIEIRKMYKRKLKQTLIFVGKSVLSQWSMCIKKYTNLKPFIIENIFHLREFYELIFEKKNMKKFNEYDIVLVKNGNIAGKFNVNELDNTKVNLSKSKSILNVFGELFIDYCWERVVLDDFDTLLIPTNAKVIPAKFTWLISATKKFPMGKRNIQIYSDNNDILKYCRPMYIDVWINRELFSFFNIGCCNSFIDKSTNASLVKYYLYNFDNPNDRFIGLIGNLGDEHKTIAEMINSDSINTASNAVGLKTSETKQNSVIDIFSKILDKKWIDYKKNLEIERYLKKFYDYYNNLSEGSITSNEILTKIKKNLKKPGPFKFILSNISYKNSSITDIVKIIESENKIQKDEYGKAIERVKDNLKHNICPITRESLTDSIGMIIIKCCGIVLSKEAVEMCYNVPKSRCVMCRSEVSKDMFIYIDKEINLDKIELSDDELEHDSESESELDNGIKKDGLEMGFDDLDLDLELDEIKKDDDVINKVNCIIKIIQGKETELSIRSQLEGVMIPGLLEGSNDYGDASPNEKKVIIFTNYSESMSNIERKLIEKNISFARLNGSARQIAEIHRKYWLEYNDIHAINVLLISGSKYCAGLDLQNTTDLIFAHKVIDKNIEMQIAGRGARYGRKKNFNIHYVLYNNELNES